MGGVSHHWSAEEHAAIQECFEGDTELFCLFRSGAVVQLPLDLAHGREAVHRGDKHRLQRLMHDLKSVLHMLGAPHLAGLAKTLELACRDHDDWLPDWATHWHGLEQQITARFALA